MFVRSVTRRAAHVFKHQFKRYPRFLAVGVFAYLIVVAGTILLTRYAKIWYLYAFMLSALASWTFSFLANSRFTFAGHPKRYLAARYAGHMASYAVFSGASFAAVYVLTSLVGVAYPASIAAVSGLSSIYTFLFSRSVIFTYA